jgi:hypothetical protein
MRFDKVINLVLEQIPKEEEKPEPQPWCLEIKKDLSMSKEYNELGDLIIRALRAKS